MEWNHLKLNTSINCLQAIVFPGVAKDGRELTPCKKRKHLSSISWAILREQALKCILQGAVESILEVRGT